MRKWLILMALMLCLPALAEDTLYAGEHGEWAYTVNADGTATLTGWRWEELPAIPAVVAVPAELDGHPLTRLGAYAFDTLDMRREVALVIPEGVTAASCEAFSDLHYITALHLPSTLTEIEPDEWGRLGFHYLSAEITVAAGNPRYTVVDGCLIDAWTDTLLYTSPSANWQPLPAVKHYGFNCLENWGWSDPWPETGKGGTLVIPEGVQTLARCTLYDNVCISRVVLPDSLTRMESATFESCAITEVEFGAGLTEIPAFAFYCCFGPEVSQITLPENITFVGFYAFDPEFTEVTALNPDCHFETEEEYLQRAGDDDLYW